MGRIIEESDVARIYEGWPYPLYSLKNYPFTAAEEELFRAIVDVLLKKNSIVYVKFKVLPEDAEKKFKESFRDDVLLKIPPQTFSKLPKEDEKKEIIATIAKYLQNFDVQKPKKLAAEIMNTVFGLGVIEALLDDDSLEEIMINGGNRAVFIFHRRLGMCRTDISIPREDMGRYIKKVAVWANKTVNENNPLLDAHLPNGDRFNATMPPVSVLGPTITIRKFRRRPFTLLDIIRNGTIPENVAAFLWLAVDGMGIAPRNILIAGGAGAGKTTTLNALLDFVPLDQRIITVEDTKELDIPLHENWAPLITRQGTKKSREISMDDLLRNALRMRPDRIIMGEVRGPEAETLFIAMDVGHQGTMGTLHANSAREVLLRITSPPMNVPQELLPLVNIIVVQHRMRTKEGAVRKVMEVAEVARMDNKVLLSNIFRWNPSKKVLERTDVPSHTLEEMHEILGVEKSWMNDELVRRERILIWAKKHVTSRDEFIKLVNAYYANPEGVYNAIS